MAGELATAFYKNFFYWITANPIYIFVHSCFHATVVELVVAAETLWPPWSEIFIIWLSMEKICQPQIYRNVCFFVFIC